MQLQIQTQRQLQEQAQPLLPRKVTDKAHIRLKVATNPEFDKDDGPEANVRFTNPIMEERMRAIRANRFHKKFAWCAGVKPLGYVDYSTLLTNKEGALRSRQVYTDLESEVIETDRSVLVAMVVAKQKARHMKDRINRDQLEHWSSLGVQERCWVILGWRKFEWVPDRIPKAWTVSKFVPKKAKEVYSICIR